MNKILTSEVKQKLKENGIKLGTFYDRITTLGWSIEDAMGKPPRKNRSNPEMPITSEIQENLKRNSISISAFYNRVYNLDWNIEDAMTRPTLPPRNPLGTKARINRKNKKRITLEVKKKLKENGIKKSTFYNRIYNLGWSVESAMTTPVDKK